MTLLHYSARAVKAYVPRPQTTGIVSFACKPDGLWLSVDEAWREVARHRKDHDFRYVYEVTLAPKAKILRLHDRRSIRRFEQRFGQVDPVHLAMKDRLEAFAEGFKAEAYFPPMAPPIAINWAEVAEKHQGVLLDPYSRRIGEITWYTPWDCASGCVWGEDAVASIERRRPW